MTHTAMPAPANLRSYHRAISRHHISPVGSQSLLEPGGFDETTEGLT